MFGDLGLHAHERYLKGIVKGLDLSAQGQAVCLICWVSEWEDPVFYKFVSEGLEEGKEA